MGLTTWKPSLGAPITEGWLTLPCRLEHIKPQCVGEYYAEWWPESVEYKGREYARRASLAAVGNMSNLEDPR
jgi:hypothetical protein